MKIVRETSKEYNAIQFDLDFVKKYGLIKYPMVYKCEESVGGHTFNTVRRDDLFGKLFGLRKTVKTPTIELETRYRLYVHFDNVYANFLPFTSHRSEEVQDGDWIVTDRNGDSKVYTPKEFGERFTKE